MPNLDILKTRRSVPAQQLAEPGPDDAQLEQLLSLAMRAPDHARLTPWRFVVLQGEARREFGRRLAALHLEKMPELAERKRLKDQQRYEHAPLVVTVVAQLQPEHPKVPVQEQVLSAGYVAYNLLLGAQDMGFGAQLLTGWAAYDEDAASLLGLTDNERVIGFVHIGTPLRDIPERNRPELTDKLAYWAP